MIVMRLMGGLGNQMFQYALGRRLARERGVPLKLDLSWFQGSAARAEHAMREYALGGWRIRASAATPEELARFAAWRRVLSALTGRNVAVVKERGPEFHPEVLRVPGHAYLIGYWQSERYFSSIRDVLLEEFSLSAEPCAHAAALARTMPPSTAVAVHVRRGDYASVAYTHDFHGLCSPEYYQEAARRIADQITNPAFFVFSDEPDWARDNLQLGWPTTYVTHGGGCAPHQDIWLMSRCAHHIIANSSFSWWGAWLCRNEAKIVVAPRRWFADAALDTRDLIPADWPRI